MNSSPLITCRFARNDDKPQVLELTRTIWEGQDYVPTVWDEWLTDHNGRLIVAEFTHRVVGLSKLTRLSDVDWWMEGLRVHPQYEGLGIASMLTERTLLTWYEIGKRLSSCLPKITLELIKAVKIVAHHRYTHSG